MAQAEGPIAEFAHQLETSLRTRRLYASHMAPYQEAAQRLLERFRAAVGSEGFSVRVGPTDLFHGKVSLLHRPKREDSFFFPLYRDGLRELTFTPDATEQELDALMTAFEAEEKRKLEPSEDTVGFLWRCDFQGITYNAIDGIGDEEVGDDEPEAGKEDYRALVAELTSKIQSPAAPTTGQSYAFVLDADVHVSASDLHYEATTTRKAFEENPTVLDLTEEEAVTVRAEVESEDENALLERFVAVLFGILTDPARNVSEVALAPVFERLLEGYWGASDFVSLDDFLSRLHRAAESAPDSGSRLLAHAMVTKFVSPERVGRTLEIVQRTVPFAQVTPIWDLAGDEAWPLLVDFLAKLPEGTLRNELLAYLRRRLRASPNLLRQTLASPEPHRIRAGLAIIDATLEGAYAKDLLDLAVHPNEAIRLKALGFAGRLGGAAGLEILWKAMEDDPAKPVRLLAFRMIAQAKVPGLANRLRALVTSPGFADRPAWEQEKYVRLLGSVAGESAATLFQSWIPTKRWFWRPEDYESAEVALHGLAACGGGSLAKVRAYASGGGKLGGIARRVMESVASAGTEMGETVTGREPGAGRGR